MLIWPHIWIDRFRRIFLFKRVCKVLNFVFLFGEKQTRNRWFGNNDWSFSWRRAVLQRTARLFIFNIIDSFCTTYFDNYISAFDVLLLRGQLNIFKHHFAWKAWKHQSILTCDFFEFYLCTYIICLIIHLGDKIWFRWKSWLHFHKTLSSWIRRVNLFVRFCLLCLLIF